MLEETYTKFKSKILPMPENKTQKYKAKTILWTHSNGIHSMQKPHGGSQENATWNIATRIFTNSHLRKDKFRVRSSITE